MFNLRTIALLSTISVATSYACLWDSETIYVERIGFPDDIQLILGAVSVRSDTFHHWRKAYSLHRIADSTKVSPADYDNLAVSLDKLHRDDSAIAVMKSKRLRYGPAYETMANMGTFFFHSGNFSEGLPYIDSALQINPEAHFGRERYQKWLVEYILGLPSRTSPLAPAKSKKDIGRIKGEHGYAAFVAKQEGMGKLSDSAREKAIRGILGMMRFGNGNHPILLEAYADLALGRKDPFGRGLASKAYMIAAFRSLPENGERIRKVRDNEPIDSTAHLGFLRLAKLAAGSSHKFENHMSDYWNYDTRMHFRAEQRKDRSEPYFGKKLRELQSGQQPDSLDLYKGHVNQIDIGEFERDETPPAWRKRRWKEYGNRN